MRKVILFRHPAGLEHDTGLGHPECADRLRAIDAGLRASGVESQVTSLTPDAAEREDLYRVHQRDYVDRILALRGSDLALDADTRVSPGSVQAAVLAAGAAINAVDRVLETPEQLAFSLTRPPGHHAESDRAMGFCLFNNVAVAAAYALARHGLKRVLIFDPDVHHGNGTQHIFENRSDVFYVSIHQYPFYPGTGNLDETGAGLGRGFTANVPLRAGLGNAEYIYIIRRLLLPVIEEYRPELVLVSAGFDAHTEDPLAQMEVTDEGFQAIYGEILPRLNSSRIPSALILEGGYSLPVLHRLIPDLIHSAATERFPKPDFGQPDKTVLPLIATLRSEVLNPG